jgi:Cu/Ag efflux protein CusF
MEIDMKNAIPGALLLILMAGPVMADPQATNHAAMQGMNRTQINKAVGIANSVDLQQGSINLTHGPVETLGWPGMTMDFNVKDKTILQGIHPGQKVAFEIVKEGPGKFYISHIKPFK